jgi:hypothetical protein
MDNRKAFAEVTDEQESVLGRRREAAEGPAADALDRNHA